MQLTNAALLGLVALVPHVLAASLHHQYPREHTGLAARLHEREAAVAPEAAPAPKKIRKRKTCTRRSSSSLSASATATATSSSSAVAVSSTATAVVVSSTSIPKDTPVSSAAPTTSTKAPEPKPTTTSSSAAQPTTTKSSGGGGGGGGSGGGSSGNTPLTPNGNKAGIAGGDSYEFLQDHIGWWYDWTPAPYKPGKPVAVSMLWGGGTSSDPHDSGRFDKFRGMSAGQYKYILGFEEPDCAAGGGSAGMSISSAAQIWNEHIAPKKTDGVLLASPSMCHQAAETWLTPFKAQINTPWDITNVHINKNNMEGVKKDIDYYFNKYGKKLWVTEFACVDDSKSFIPCTDQGEINSFISQIVDLFEADDRVAAYAYSDGEGLGSVWPTVKNGKLSASGQAYLDALKRYH